MYPPATAGTGKGCCSACNKPSRFSAGISETGTAFPTVAMTMGKWGEHHTDVAHPPFWIKSNRFLNRFSNPFFSLYQHNKTEECGFQYAEPGKISCSILRHPWVSLFLLSYPEHPDFLRTWKKKAQEDAKGWIKQMPQAKLPQCHNTGPAQPRVRSWSSWGDVLSPSSRSSSGPWDTLSTLPPTNKSNWNHQALKINPSSSQTSSFECMEESFDAKSHFQRAAWAWFLLSFSISAASASPCYAWLWHPNTCHRRTASNPAVLVNFTSSLLLIITKSRPGRVFHLFLWGWMEHCWVEGAPVFTVFMRAGIIKEYPF